MTVPVDAALKAPPLRVGVAGAGFVGRDVHLPAWSRVPGAVVAAICDPDPAALARAAALAPGAALFPDPRAMLAFGVDAVSVCAPNLAHAAIVRDALRAGAHVFVEKPLATTPASVRALGLEAEALGRMLAVRHQLRFGAGAASARERAACLGPIRSIRARALRRDRIPTTPGLTDAVLAGGGAALDLGSHVLDMALWLAGLTAADVEGARVTGRAGSAYGRGEVAGYRNAWGAWDAARFTVEDSASARMVLRGGATLSLECAWAGDFPAGEAGTWCELEGAGGTLRWDAPSGALRSEEAPPDFLAFAESCRTGTPYPVTWRDALGPVLLLDAFYRSVREGREVEAESAAIPEAARR